MPYRLIYLLKLLCKPGEHNAWRKASLDCMRACLYDGGLKSAGGAGLLARAQDKGIDNKGLRSNFKK